MSSARNAWTLVNLPRGRVKKGKRLQSQTGSIVEKLATQDPLVEKLLKLLVFDFFLLVGTRLLAVFVKLVESFDNRAHLLLDGRATEKNARARRPLGFGYWRLRSSVAEIKALEAG